jgi:hypothetical protein
MPTNLNEMPLYGLYEGVQFEWFGQEIGNIFPGKLAIYFCFAIDFSSLQMSTKN